MAEFKDLDSTLRAEGLLAGVKLPRDPATSWRSFMYKVVTLQLPAAGTEEVSDDALLLASALNEYLQAIMAVPAAANHVAFRGFLQPAARPDWPAAVGVIDLAKHDLPHASSYTEWWYYNMHWTDDAGNQWAAFLAFFRILKHVDKESGRKYYAHAINWALTDVATGKYYQTVFVDKDSPAMLKQQLERGHVIKDKRLRKAYMEILERDSVPLPDRKFDTEIELSMQKFDLDYKCARVTKNAAGEYCITATSAEHDVSVEFVLTPKKNPVRHGLNGVVKGHDNDDMFYYLIPRCELRGSCTVNGRTHACKGGSGWYDHEFGGFRKEGEEVDPKDYAWNWAAIQLDNGYEVSTAVLMDPSTTPPALMETRVIVIDPAGRRSVPEDLEFEGTEYWTSMRTFIEYPTKWTVKAPSVGLDLTLTSPVKDQEFVTLIAKPAFWEGVLNVEGTMGGKPVRGRAYVERNGFATLSELPRFFKAVGKATMAAVQEVYPDDPTVQQLVPLVADKGTEYYMEGVDPTKIYRGLIAPLRFITDRGGKSWRSYGALACVDVVGGDSRKFAKWLAAPEFMHVGSLIVDDIQDKSEVRRGGPCCHKKYGDEVAINAGTAAYFMAQGCLRHPDVVGEQMVRVYEYYFAALRGGHAGQALDIEGQEDIMDESIEANDSALLESRVLATHMLKTGVPAGALARMGADVGGGTVEQVEAVGKYFESLGVAFQIMDDVLNLRGLFTNEADRLQGIKLKSVGEDITAGKVTFPLIKAIGKAPKEQMKQLWATVRTKPEDFETIKSVIDQLEELGAIDDCVNQSIELVEGAWAKLDPLVPDSFSKIMLRSFGWFVTERHY